MKRILCALMLALSISFAVLNAPAAGEDGNIQQESIFQSVSPVQAMRMLQERDDITFLDVRTPQERANGAIPGSRLVSFFALAKGGLNLPKDKPVLLVCAVGGRSYVAGQLMSRQGYKEVYNLSGGVKAWHQAGLPLVQDSQSLVQSAGR